MTIHEIQRLTAARFGVTRCDLLSRRQGFAQARPRQAAMWLARHVTPCSFPEIGRAFDRDHSTVMHDIRKVDERMAQDQAFAALMWDLLAAVDPVESVEIRRLRMRRVAA